MHVDVSVAPLDFANQLANCASAQRTDQVAVGQYARNDASAERDAPAVGTEQVGYDRPVLAWTAQMDMRFRHSSDILQNQAVSQPQPSPAEAVAIVPVAVVAVAVIPVAIVAVPVAVVPVVASVSDGTEHRSAGGKRKDGRHFVAAS